MTQREQIFLDRQRGTRPPENAFGKELGAPHWSKHSSRNAGGRRNSVSPGRCAQAQSRALHNRLFSFLRPSSESANYTILLPVACHVLTYTNSGCVTLVSRQKFDKGRSNTPNSTADAYGPYGERAQRDRLIGCAAADTKRGGSIGHITRR